MKLPKCSIDMHVYLALEKQDEKTRREAEKAAKISQMEELLLDVAKAFSVDIYMVHSGDTQSITVLVRKIFYYISKVKLKGTYPAMAKIAGRMDHATAIYHVKKVKAWFKVKDPDFLDLWDQYLSKSKLYTKKDFS